MKVVIDIPEDDYKLACNYPDALIACYAHYIKEGTVLPNNHGRLIDADELANKTFYSKTGAPYITYHRFVNAPTVIEAEEAGKTK